jgi:hypothetical protein
MMAKNPNKCISRSTNVAGGGEWERVQFSDEKMECFRGKRVDWSCYGLIINIVKKY